MLISLDDQDVRPIFLQIAAQIKEQIRRGELHPGEDLPSVRELAGSLGINLHTVHRAYQKLREEGVVRFRLGQRAKVAPVREAPAQQEMIETRLVARLRELITEAYHLGVSPSEFQRLVDELLTTESEFDEHA